MNDLEKIMEILAERAQMIGLIYYGVKMEYAKGSRKNTVTQHVYVWGVFKGGKRVDKIYQTADLKKIAEEMEAANIKMKSAKQLTFFDNE